MSAQPRSYNHRVAPADAELSLERMQRHNTRNATFFALCKTCAGLMTMLTAERWSGPAAGQQSSGGGPRRASLEPDVQLNKWGFVPGGDDTLELNLMSKGASAVTDHAAKRTRICCVADVLLRSSHPALCSPL